MASAKGRIRVREPNYQEVEGRRLQGSWCPFLPRKDQNAGGKPAQHSIVTHASSTAAREVPFQPAMTPGSKWGLLTLSLIAAFVAVAGLLLLERGGHAVQAPRMALDMVTAGNTYDEASNTMVLGPIENCSTSAAPGNNAQHNHIVHLILQDVVDLIGWQVRLNYDGGRMRPSAVNFTPFAASSSGQNVSFTNLPIDPATGVHRDIVSAGNIQPAAPGAQTALIGAVYSGPQNAQISPDTPANAPPDDTSYSAPGGGVVAALTLQVLPGQAGQASLTMDLDDANPNPPGTDLHIFTGDGFQTVNLAENALFDGYHAEGASCVPPAGIPPVQGDDPGFPDPPPGNGAGGTTVPGATSPGEASPGEAGTSEASPGGTATGSPAPDGQTAGTEGTEDGGGTPVWVYLVAIVAPLAALATFAAWRFRSRLPWSRT